MKLIKDYYIDGVCPDCGVDISDDVVDGQACEECGHVFFEPKPSGQQCCSCGSEKLISVQSHSRDCNHVELLDCGREYDGYVPEELKRIRGDSDSLRFVYCDDCGMIQSK